MLEVLSCGCEIKLKRDKLRCSKCGELACPKHTFSRVDESNRAITKNAHLFCVNCLPHLTPRVLDFAYCACDVQSSKNFVDCDYCGKPIKRQSQ